MALNNTGLWVTDLPAQQSLVGTGNISLLSNTIATRRRHALSLESRISKADNSLFPQPSLLFRQEPSQSFPTTYSK